MVSLTSLHGVVHVNMTEINSASNYITKPRLETPQQGRNILSYKVRKFSLLNPRRQGFFVKIELDFLIYRQK